MIKKEILNRKLKLEFENGLSESGRELKKTKTYSNLNEKAELEDIYDFAKDLSSLCKKEHLATKTVIEELLTKEG